MSAKKKVLLAWSTGKDAAWTLHVLRQDPQAEIAGLLTTLNTTHDRVAMHSTHRRILEAQARAVGLGLAIVPLPWPCDNDVYEKEMRRAVEEAAGRGVTHVAFGDLFLREVREYREKNLAGTGLEPLFPLWGLSTRELSKQMVEGGVEAILTCVDPKKLPRSFAGRRYDRALLGELPEGVDPCGENGEFHSCVLDGPAFREPLRMRAGEIVERDGFVFADVIPENNGGPDASRS